MCAGVPRDDQQRPISFRSRSMRYIVIFQPHPVNQFIYNLYEVCDLKVQRCTSFLLMHSRHFPHCSVNDFHWQNTVWKSLPALSSASDLFITLFCGQACVIVFVYNQVNWSPIKGRQINTFSTGLLFLFKLLYARSIYTSVHLFILFLALFPFVQVSHGTRLWACGGVGSFSIT